MKAPLVALKQPGNHGPHAGSISRKSVHNGRNPANTITSHSPKVTADQGLGSSSRRTTPSPPAQPNTKAGTPLRIPYGNKDVAIKLGARYGSAGWYAPPGVDLSAFGEREWLTETPPESSHLSAECIRAPRVRARPHVPSPDRRRCDRT